jgi:hypothetical protein
LAVKGRREPVEAWRLDAVDDQSSTAAN